MADNEPPPAEHDHDHDHDHDYDSWSHEALVRRLHGLERALNTRDIIGQAKGVLIATTRCSSDDAFTVLRTQSQHENRKLLDVARGVVDHATRRVAPRIADHVGAPGQVATVLANAQ